jgi:hypothetical protein
MVSNMSEKTRVTLQLIFFIMFGNMFLNAYVLLSDMPNKWYVIGALIVLYITSVITIIWISSKDPQVVQPTFKEDTEIIVEIPNENEKPVVKIENAFNDEPVVVTHVVEDDEFVRVKSNGRKYSKMRGHGSKRTRARQPWIGARKAERVVNFDVESNGHWLVSGISGGVQARHLLLMADMERLKEKGIEWKLEKS